METIKIKEIAAQEIFDMILLGKTSSSAKNSYAYSLNNINLYFSSKKVDITMLEKIASTYKQENPKDFMIRSFNFSELSVVKILVAGLSDLNIQRYIDMKSSNQELELFIKNMNLILDDVDFENIDDKDPFDNFDSYINQYLPKIVYIEGIDAKKMKDYKKELELIKAFSKQEIEFELGFTNIEQSDFYNVVEKCKTYFTDGV
jgi:hypothetical protein